MGKGIENRSIGAMSERLGACLQNTPGEFDSR